MLLIFVNVLYVDFLGVTSSQMISFSFIPVTKKWLSLSMCFVLNYVPSPSSNIFNSRSILIPSFLYPLWYHTFGSKGECQHGTTAQICTQNRRYAESQKGNHETSLPNEESWKLSRRRPYLLCRSSKGVYQAFEVLPENRVMPNLRCTCKSKSFTALPRLIY